MTAAIVPVTGEASGLALRGDVESAGRYMRAARSPRTVEAYRAAWGAFESWARDRGLVPLPASPGAVASYLAHRTDEGAAPASIALYLSGICEAHRAAGHDARALRSSAEVRTVVAGIRRTVGTAQRQAAPLTPEELRPMLSALAARGLAGIRDRALLLVGWSAALRRSELVALDVEAFTFSSRGVEVRIARSKVDQEGAGRVVAVPFGLDADACPVRALRAWLDAAQLQGGAVFRSVDRWGRVGERLTGRDVARLVKRAGALAGLDVERLSGHSLRAGLATTAALAGKDDRAIQRQTGHASRTMLDRYVRTADAWRDNAAAGLL